MKAAAKALEIPEHMMMSLGERPVFNSFNNNQEGDNNHYSGNSHEKQEEMMHRLAHLEGKVETLEKI